jgi:hypothetical protein
MILKNKVRFVAVGVVSLTAIALVAGSASAVSQTNGSAAWVSVYDTNAALTTNSTNFAWAADAYASASSTDVVAAFTCPATSTGAFTFISAPGDEAKPGSWKASAPLGGLTITTASLTPSLQVNGAAGAVKTAGGDYSLGIACTKNDGVTAVAAGGFYRSISVTAGTGVWHTTDTEAFNNFRFTTSPVSQTVATGANATFTSVTAGEPAGSSIKWQSLVSGGSWTDIAGATLADLTITNAQEVNSGVSYRAVASNGSATITSAEAVLTVSSQTGTVGLNATVVNAKDGTLSLAVSNSAPVAFGAATLVGNFSTSTGTLPTIVVDDKRVNGRQGWDLSADVSDFAYLSNTISKTQLGLVPTVVPGTASGTSAGATLVAGSAAYPAVIASGLADSTVGTTSLNGALTFVAPQAKPAGTYTSTMTLTVTSK